MPDYLKNLPVDQVAAWYRRLADRIGQERVQGRVPYASLMLRTYLDNRAPNETYRFYARPYLRDFSEVVDALTYHRRVFLSQEEARVGFRTTLGIRRPITRLAGIVPRLRGTEPSKLSVPGQVKIDYESLVQVGDNDADMIRIQFAGTAIERDLFTSLRGFQLHSQVVLRVRQQGDKVRVDFVSWNAWVRDRYDFDTGEGIRMPNPDYGSRRPGAVQPKLREFRVYHANAKRMEDAGLAMPYPVVSTP